MPELRVNGGAYELDVPGRDVARRGAPRRDRPHRDEDRLQRGPLRRLHGARRRHADALVHHARAPGRGARGDDDRGPARPSAGRRVRPRGRACSAASARPGRSCRRSRSSRARPTRRPRRSATAWPATSAAAAPTRRSRRRSARGATDPHREGGRGPVRGGLPRRRRGRARAVAGGPARRRRPAGAARRTASPGRAARRSTPATSALPGMLHTAVAAQPVRRARGSTRIDLSAALAAPGVRGAIGPGDIPVLSADCNYEGAAGRGRLRRHAPRRRRPPLALIDVEWEVLEPLLDPDEAVARGRAARPARRSERGDLERGLAEADVVVEATYRTQVVLHNSMETHQSVVPLGRRHARGLHLDAVRLGRPRRARRGARARPRPGARRSATTWAAASARRTAPTTTRSSRPSSRGAPGRPVRCALTRREENVAAGNRNATIQRLVAGARADGTLTALGGEYVNAVGFVRLEQR